MYKEAHSRVLEFATTPQSWSPHVYQKNAIKFLLERACAGLFLDPG